MKKRYLYCLTFFVLIYIPFIELHSFFVNVFLLFFIGLLILKELKTIRFPKIFRTLLLILTIGVVYLEHETFKGIGPGVTFLSFLGILKLFEMTEQRDFYLFVLIAQLMVAGNLLLHDSLLMIVYIAVMSTGLFFLLLTFHKKSEGRKLSKERLLILFKITFTSIPITIALFFLFPRITIGNIFFNTMKSTGLSGFTQSLKPGELSHVVLDKSAVFRSSFLEIAPKLNEMYWRGAVLSETDGFSWKNGSVSRSLDSKYTDQVEGLYQVSFASFDEGGHLFTLEKTASIIKMSRGSLRQGTGGTFKIRPLSNKKVVYKGVKKKVGSVNLIEKKKALYLELPSKIDPLFKNWAHKQGSFSSLKEATHFFYTHIKKNYRYSLSPGKSLSAYPLDEFFFKKKIGFCEHFASSLAIFLRLKGFPSRIVVGFLGGEFNDIGNYYLIRKSDAHAWVEAWDKSRGWLRFDPTNAVAPERVSLGASAYFEEFVRDSTQTSFFKTKRGGVFRRLFLIGDMLYYKLNTRFVNYDFDEQKRLLNNFKEKKKMPWKLGSSLIILIFISIYLYRRLFFDQEKDFHFEAWFEIFLKKLRSIKIDIPSGLTASELRVKLAYCTECQRILELYIDFKYRNKWDGALYDEYKRLIKRINLKELTENCHDEDHCD